MFRLLGILFGSAIAVAALILLVGIPQLHSSDEAQPVSVQLPLQAEPLPAPEPVTELPVAAEVAQAPEPPPIPAVTATTPDTETEAPPLAEEEAVPAPVSEAEPVTEAEAMRWYAFWSPFRSQLAANGFVAQLQRVTGLDYRVVSVKPGVYEVAFAYSSDAEIQANLSQISAATGLDMPES